MTQTRFHDLHQGESALLLPNAWDAGSARLAESLGAQAIATTSAGVAWSRGYPDGDALAVEQLLATVGEIFRVIQVPLSVDLEGGYSDDPEEVAELVAQVTSLGAVGINLEDGGQEPELLAAKIRAIRQRLADSDTELFINARTDVYLRGLAEGEAAVQEVIRRAELYQSAGSSGLFVPALAEPTAITAIATAAQPNPLNLMLVPGLPSTDALYQLGVRRLSAGSAIAQAALATAARLTEAFLNGSQAELTEAPAMEYGEVNQLFAGHSAD
ncbi:2-methylisocitrate lyase-like PEP mutase family enzyme [Psychromicrobium silvestre]|uniref:2-methylisocitrate lyase-like PEP mutase family enzyme n=1 Tax=Psychromicrobium silvestre TaxID=1645614 RepID=A0A7Y9S6Z6_9MICC|nr:2-methylisocitrate lyase-like PEP mutase family enzyme [Psychromicrobium silvestre]